MATYYFTKWVEAKPMKEVNQSYIIQFIKENIVYHFGLLESITKNMGTVFTGQDVRQFAEDFGI